MASMFWKKVAQIVLDSADPDMRRFQAHLLEKMRDSPAGDRFAKWASGNEVAFEALVRACAGVVKGKSRDLRSKGMLADAFADQLAALPFEFRRAFTSSGLRSNLRAQLSAPDVQDDRALLEWMIEATSIIEGAHDNALLVGWTMRELFRRLEPENFLQLVESNIQMGLGRSVNDILENTTPQRRAELVKFAGEQFPEMDINDIAEEPETPEAQVVLDVARQKRKEAFTRGILGRDDGLSTMRISDGELRTTARVLAVSMSASGVAPQNLKSALMSIQGELRVNDATDARPRFLKELIKETERISQGEAKR